jgi:hypothetical protein
MVLLASELLPRIGRKDVAVPPKAHRPGMHLTSSFYRRDEWLRKKACAPARTGLAAPSAL